MTRPQNDRSQGQRNMDQAIDLERIADAVESIAKSLEQLVVEYRP